MQRFGAILIAAMFVLSSIAANAQQSIPERLAGQAENSPIADTASDCNDIFSATLRARQVLEHDRRVLSVPALLSDPPENDTSSFSGSDAKQDLEILEQRQAQLNRCMLEEQARNDAQRGPSDCLGEELLRFQMNHQGEEEREIPIWHLPGSTAFFYEAGMTIDADGAPNAYHPDNTGLDDLANAGEPGKWEGLAKNADGAPMLQGPDDPFPGYYISETALADRSKPINDPKRYVDASKIPYIVLPGPLARQVGARPGDFTVVLNQRNGKTSYAIFGDVGPVDRIGEGSVALAENLGIRSDARNGGTRWGIVYLVFPGSGNGRPRAIDEINSESEKLLQSWGDTSQLTACTAQAPARLF